MRRRVVIVGGGFAGVRIAQLLGCAKLPDETEVVLIDRTPYHTLRPKLPQAIGGRIPCAVHIPLANILKPVGVRFLEADITGINPERREVRWDDGALTADILVLTMGGESRVPPFTGNVLPIWSFDEACNIRRRVEFMAKQAARGKPVNPDVVVVGGGFVGVELAAEIQARLQRLTEGRAQVTLLEASGRLLPRLGEWTGQRAAQHLTRLGVKILLDGRVADVVRDGVMLENGWHIPAGTVVWAGGVKPPLLLVQTGLAGETGMLDVNDQLESVRWPGVFAAGDCAHVVGRKPDEQSAQRALHQAETVAHNVLASLWGRTGKAYRHKPAKYVLGLGPGYGILEAPRFHLAGWLPAMMKEGIMAGHLWQLGGASLFRTSAPKTLWMALRPQHWDGDPLMEGNVISVVPKQEMAGGHSK